jgi:hypothetical protein
MVVMAVIEVEVVVASLVQQSARMETEGLGARLEGNGKDPIGG